MVYYGSGVVFGVIMCWPALKLHQIITGAAGNDAEGSVRELLAWMVQVNLVEQMVWCILAVITICCFG